MSDLPPPPPPEFPVDAVEELKLRMSRLEDAEYQELDSNSRYRDLLIAEVRQRIWIRYGASAVALIVIMVMAGYAAHAVHNYFFGRLVLIPSSLAIVLFLAPVTSVTAITITLLVGAFRRFKDDDMEKIDAKSIISEAVKIGQSH